MHSCARAHTRAYVLKHSVHKQTGYEWDILQFLAVVFVDEVDARHPTCEYFEGLFLSFCLSLSKCQPENLTSTFVHLVHLVWLSRSARVTAGAYLDKWGLPTGEGPIEGTPNAPKHGEDGFSPTPDSQCRPMLSHACLCRFVIIEVYVF
jgi:hypothetical protein